MGVVENVGYDAFPEQGRHLGKEVKVFFHYQVHEVVKGVIVRDDMQHPWETIIKLEDGRYVRGTECQYAFPRK